MCAFPSSQPLYIELVFDINATRGGRQLPRETFPGPASSGIAPVPYVDDMSSLDHPTVAKVATALSEAGHRAAAEGITILPDEVRTATQAAAALGVDVGAIANSLVFRGVYTASDGTEEHVPLLVLTSGSHRAETTALATLAGATRIDKADPDFVKNETGQVIGGVAPVGHRNRLRTLVDTALCQYDVVWAAAGHAKSVFPTTYTGLLAMTGGTAADVTGESAP